MLICGQTFEVLSTATDGFGLLRNPGSLKCAESNSSTIWLAEQNGINHNKTCTCWYGMPGWLHEWKSYSYARGRDLQRGDRRLTVKDTTVAMQLFLTYSAGTPKEFTQTSHACELQVQVQSRKHFQPLQALQVSPCRQCVTCVNLVNQLSSQHLTLINLAAASAGDR